MLEVTQRREGVEQVRARMARQSSAVRVSSGRAMVRRIVSMLANAASDVPPAATARRVRERNGDGRQVEIIIR